jgi:phage repressor protein C with HTH and peptisase S24 domain
MQTIEEIRHGWLLKLIDKHGTVAALNEALGRDRTDATLTQIKNRAPNSGSDNPRNMGSALAREIEEKLGMDRGVMDNPPQDSASALLPGITLRSYPEVSASMGPGQTVPSDWVPFEQITLSLDWVRERLPQDHSNDLVRVNGRGDSMEPYFHDGDLLICDIGFDREARLKPGIYLFRVDDELFAKRLERIPGGWRALNGDGSEAFRIGKRHKFEPVARVLAAWKRNF